MYLDLVCDDNYINVNIMLAKTVGIEAATYFAELLNILKQVVKKRTYDKDKGTFKLDRKYMESRTTLSAEEQMECEAVLAQLEMLTVIDPISGELLLNLETYCKVITGELIVESKRPKLKQKEKAEAKQNGKVIGAYVMIDALQCPAELTEALHDWAEAVYANKKYLTRPIINLFVENIVQFTPDLNEQIEIVKRATANGYTDSTWITDRMTRNRPKSAATLSVPQTAAVSFSDETF